MSPRSRPLERYASIRDWRHRFGARSVAELYPHRPPYSDDVYALLLELLAEPRVILDAGCGTGKLARRLVASVERVDAIDSSGEMLRVGRTLERGDDRRLRWIQGSVEDAPLAPRYGLAVCGASFHWFDPDRALARFAQLLAPGAFLAVLDGDGAWRAPWEDAERAVLIDFVTRLRGERPVWEPIDLDTARLLEHPRFEPVGECVTAPAAFEQRVEDYVACQHSRASFTHEVMGPDLVAAFDAALRGVLEPHARDGWLRYARRTRIEWGRPCAAKEEG